ncbi:hypothetical protein V6N11_048260 [Hibiscus sabdariffa]|uniref:RNase H type-1 domain-containing protein n=1 Tax=Hibiscus sabdariffa TaxID=183260 RepID=A0ABR2PUN9_9ROSI
MWSISCWSCSLCIVSESAWQQPVLGTMKFIVDGAASGEVASCGGVLKNLLGEIKTISSCPVQGVRADFAELMAIKTALVTFVVTG